MDSAVASEMSAASDLSAGVSGRDAVKIVAILATAWLITWISDQLWRLPMEVWLKLFDLAASAAWPSVALISAYWFRREIAHLTKRVIKAGNFEFEPPQQEKSNAALMVEFSPIINPSDNVVSSPTLPTVVPPEMGATPLPTTTSSPAREPSYFSEPASTTGDATLDTLILKIHEGYQSNADMTREHSERKLAQNLAQALLWIDFNEISYVVYGSQIKLMQLIERLGLVTKWMWDVHWKTYRPSPQPGEHSATWLSWLVGRELVRVDSDEAVTLTPKGRDFLNWARRQNRDLSLNAG